MEKMTADTNSWLGAGLLTGSLFGLLGPGGGLSTLFSKSNDNPPADKSGQQVRYTGKDGVVLDLYLLERIDGLVGGYYAVQFVADGSGEDVSQVLVYVDRDEKKRAVRCRELREMRQLRGWINIQKWKEIECKCFGRSFSDAGFGGTGIQWPETYLNPENPMPKPAEVMCKKHLKLWKSRPPTENSRRH